MGAVTANLAVAAALLLAGVASVLFLVGLVSYRRTRRPRLLWVALGFAALAVQGAIYVRATFAGRGALAAGTEPFPVLLLWDLAVVFALYLAVLRP